VAELPEPYWQDEVRGLRLFLGDCRAILPCFADGEFGSVVTDPPYGVGIADWDIPPDSAILQECLRVTTGTVVMWCGSHVRSLLHFLALGPDRVCAWSPSVRRGAPVQHGMAYYWSPFLLWRPPRRQAVIGRDITHWPTDGNGHNAFGHPCRKPEAGIEDLCRAFGGESVLDCYSGSGTTGAACARLGVPCTMIEMQETECIKTVARLTEDLTYGPRSLFNQGAPDA